MKGGSSYQRGGGDPAPHRVGGLSGKSLEKVSHLRLLLALAGIAIASFNACSGGFVAVTRRFPREA